MNFIDIPPPGWPYFGQVEPHHTTKTIWSVLFRNQEHKPIYSWLNPPPIGVKLPPLKLPKVKSGYGISIDDIIEANPMCKPSKLLFQSKQEEL
jgi:hypothetical protein